MQLPTKQADIYRNLDRVTMHMTSQGRQTYRLDGKDCRHQIAGLVVRGLVTRDNDRGLKRIGQSPALGEG